MIGLRQLIVLVYFVLCPTAASPLLELRRHSESLCTAIKRLKQSLRGKANNSEISSSNNAGGVGDDPDAQNGSDDNDIDEEESCE